MANIKCPLMEENIKEEICFDIHMVAEGLAPAYTVSEKVVNTPDFKEICLNCPYHRD